MRRAYTRKVIMNIAFSCPARQVPWSELGYPSVSSLRRSLSMTFEETLTSLSDSEESDLEQQQHSSHDLETVDGLTDGPVEETNGPFHGSLEGIDDLDGLINNETRQCIHLDSSPYFQHRLIGVSARGMIHRRSDPGFSSLAVIKSNSSSSNGAATKRVEKIISPSETIYQQRNDGTSSNGTSSSEGTSSNGASSNDTSSSNGTSSNGTSSNGTSSNATSSNGTSSNGTCSKGTISNGTSSNGTSNGTSSNGTSNGTCSNGTFSNGTTSNGTCGIIRQQFPGTSDIKRTQSCSDLKVTEKIVPTSISTNTLRQSTNRSLPDIHKVTSGKKLRELLSHPFFDPNIRNKHGDTPLHTYIRDKVSSRVKLMSILLSSGVRVDINARDSNDFTPLHLAAEKGDASSASVLIAFGADPMIKDCQNQIPIDVAPRGTKARDLLKTFAFKPGMSTIKRSRCYSIPSTSVKCTSDMIGYYLNWRREASLCLKIEQEISKMLHDDEINDITEAGAAFVQMNHINCWKKTRGSQSRPGSRVLFLDGGGIRGLIEIEVLMEIEYRTEKKITDLFDWIVGTSTGGIIALALVYTNLSLKDIKNLYLRMCPNIFGGSFLKAAQRSSNMEQVLRNTFQDAVMSSIAVPKIMVAAVNISKTLLEVEFFNNFNDDEKKNHLIDVPVWMVARATTAAPKDFMSFNGYVDGGVKANNPCEFALSEIYQYYHDHRQSPPYFPIMVSVGTGIVPAQRLDSNFSLSFTGELKNVFTPKHLFDLLVYAISGSEEVAKKFHTQCVHHGTPFFRFNPTLSEEIKPTETNIEKLINMIIDTKSYLMTGEAMSKTYEMIRVFDQLDELGKNEIDF